MCPDRGVVRAGGVRRGVLGVRTGPAVAVVWAIRPPPQGSLGKARASHGGTSRRRAGADRKSTRLNTSHVAISYAVFCLKKKMESDESLKLQCRTQAQTKKSRATQSA